MTDIYTKQIRKFVNHLIVYRTLSDSTINLYSKMISNILKNFNTVIPSHKMIQDHIISIKKVPYSSNYIRNIIVAIEIYMQYIKHPIKLARPNKDKKILEEILTEAEVSVLLASTKNIREKAIMSLLAYSGARNREVCNIKVKNVDFEKNQINIVTGKGGKSRVCPITTSCINVLSEYLNKYPRSQDSYLFTTIRHDKHYSTW